MPSTLATPPPFSPPAAALWTNSLWFLSMASSLLSAMLAMLLRQWARRYGMAIQQPWLTPDQRARVREALTNGSCLFWVTFPMAFFLCVSLVFYVTGGLIFLFNIDRIVFGSGALCAVHGGVLYFLYTAASIFKPEILFYTPFSELVLRISFGVWDIVLRVSSCIPPLRRLCETSRRRYRDLSLRYHEGLLKGKCMGVVGAASKRLSEFDPNVLEWTFNYVADDAALEQFFGAIPGFFDSKLVNTLQGRLSDKFQTKFHQALNGFLDHTFSSNTFTGSGSADRLVICLNAARAALGPGAVSQILCNIFEGCWPVALQSIEVGHTLRHWGHSDIQFSSHIRKIIARIVSRVQPRERDERWISLVQDEFGIPGRALREHVVRGDSASLAILIHATQQFLRTDSPPWDPDILRDFSDFDIYNTLPAQQHEFCTAWNEVVREAQNRGAGSTPDLILERIGQIFSALHQATSDTGPVAYSGSIARDDETLPEPLPYPFCRVVDHRLDSNQDPHLDEGPAKDVPLSPLQKIPDAMPCPTLIPTTPSQPVPPEGRSAASAEISAIPHTTNTAPCSTFGGGPARRKAQETEPSISSSTGFDLPPTPTPTSMPPLSSRPLHSALPGAMDAIATRSDHDPTLGTPLSSSSDAARLSIPAQASTFSDKPAALGVGGAGTPNDTQDPNRPIVINAMESYHRPPARQSAPSTPNIPAATLRREPDVQHRTRY